MVSIWFNKDKEDHGRPFSQIQVLFLFSHVISHEVCYVWPSESTIQPLLVFRVPAVALALLPSHPPHPRLRSQGNHKRDCWPGIEGWSIPEWSLCPLCQLCHPPEKWWKISKFFVEPSFLATIILRTSMTSQLLVASSTFAWIQKSCTILPGDLLIVPIFTHNYLAIFETDQRNSPRAIKPVESEGFE